MCIGAAEEPSLTSYANVDDDTCNKILSISQDIIYLASKGKKQTPKSLSLGLTIRHLTGSSQLLRIIHQYGHCASPDTIRMYETSLAVLRLESNEKIPKGFDAGKLVTMVWDNIDFNEETPTGHGTTHHTNGIMVQKEVSHVVHPELSTVKKGIRSLTPKIVPLQEYHCVERQGPRFDTDVEEISVDVWEPFIEWAKQTDFLYILSRRKNPQIPGWTGFNVRQQLLKGTLVKSAIYYRPVIEASPTEMRTVNEILTRSSAMAARMQVDQIVLVFDLAIYAKIQQIRWGNDVLKERFVVRLGEFHAAMSFLSVIGKRFGEAGLKDIVIESGIVAEGSINGVLSGHHYNRSINTMKVMYEAMERLRISSFLESQSEDDLTYFDSAITTIEEFPVSQEFADLFEKYQQFCIVRRKEDPTFELWSSFLEMVSLLLIFLRATRESDWNLHVAVLRLMMPWYFAYDRTNYSRYLPAYWMEMVDLPESHPSLYHELSQMGAWTVQRHGNHAFASIAYDQAIEETLNRDCKTPGGIKGITINRGAVQRWILAQPERAAIARECEVMAGDHKVERVSKELDQPRIRRLEESVTSVISTIKSMINPFENTTGELVAISSGAVAIDAVKDDLLNAKAKGEAATQEFIKERLLVGTGSKQADFHDTIKQQKLKTFADNCTSKRKACKEIFKDGKVFFARLLVAGQKRNLDLQEVFQYSLSSVSFPLSNIDGTMAKTDKSALMRVLEEKCTDVQVTKIPQGAIMLHAMAHLQLLRDIPDTFGKLSDLVLTQIVNMASTNGCSRLDFVGDTYPKVSIKGMERERRAGGGSEVITIYGPEQKTPRQFKKFLSAGINKEALLGFLFQSWSCARFTTDITIYVAHGKFCHKLSWTEQGCCQVEKCPTLHSDHEEADTRLILHAVHASSEHSSVTIKSPDTDVAILALSHGENIASDLYFWTGTGRRRRVINLTEMRNQLGKELCYSLVGLHTFTGCDSTSAFYGKGKKKAFDIVESEPDFQRVFTLLGSDFELVDELQESLEQFVCHLYGHPGNDVNHLRYKLFCSSSASERSLPPCKNALIQHSRRANYQAAIHRKALIPYIYAPSPDGHGWAVNDGEIKVVWMTQPSAPDKLLVSVSCSCKVSKCLQGRCSCRKQDLVCTDLCKCTDCENVDIITNAVDEVEIASISHDDDDLDDIGYLC